jgi:subtilase-type serine protease
MSTLSSRFLSLASTTACGAIALTLATPAQAIVPNDNFSPSDVIDATGANGVGMFFRNDGFVCSGTLINPRTVLFAAHCVNDRPESDYDTNGTIQSAFSFDDNALPGFQYWINNGFSSNPDLFVYNIGQIHYNPDSLADPNAFGFLEGDVAVAALSDRADNVPTWAILFSPLPTPDAPDPVTGTGYHVNITGYGRSGNGTDGAIQGIDWRRRAAENMLGALTSFDERNVFLFGDPFGDLPQSLYRLDFDDPNKTNPFDFNLYQDEPLEREATTAGGDSGGPLVLDAANNSLSNEDLVLAVLSGGTRFFGPQVFSSYGTESFYQPLYLFWDYIAEVNPYRYVSAVGGNGQWEDPNHWVSELDPAYRIIDANGNVINGIPTSPGAGIDGGSPDFGVVCFDPEGANEGDGCQDLATGDPVPPYREGDGAGAGTLEVAYEGQRGRATLGLGELREAPSGEMVPQGSDGGPPEFADAPLPTPTIENGLPGATGFVPNNVDPNPSTGQRARYFDVTLSEAGRTLLSSDVEIDRLTVAGDARLVIDNRADLTVIGDFTQTGGVVDVGGRLTTGEALLVAGQFRGRGVFDPTFFTVVAGTINPRGNDMGTLTVRGDVILSSGATTIFDIVRNRNDRITVKGDADNPGYFISGGTAVFRMGTGAPPRDGQRYNIVHAERVIGEFDRVVGGVGILNPVLSYDNQNIRVTLEAGSMAAALVNPSPAALSFANALDTLRADSYNSLYGVYGALDVMNFQSLTDTLSSFAPSILNEAGAVSLGQQDMMVDVVTNRLSMLGTQAHRPGTFSVVGAPEMLGIAASNSSVSSSAATQMSFAGRVVPTGRTMGTLPDNVSGFISGGFENRRTATRAGSRSDNQANWHIAMGMEVELTDNLTVGGASAFINGRSNIQGSEARLLTNQAMAYASYRLGGGAYVAGLGSASVTDIETLRLANGGFETARFGNDTRAFNYTTGVETGMNIGIARGFELTPRAAVRYSHSEIEGYSEAGSEIALSVDNIRRQRLEGRVGFNFQGERALSNSWTIRPQISADYVQAISQSGTEMTVRFAQAADVPIVLPGIGTDSSWTEVRGGVSLSRGNLSLTTAFETDIGRDELRDDRAVAELSFRF